jgi:hypothetical protein
MAFIRADHHLVGEQTILWISRARPAVDRSQINTIRLEDFFNGGEDQQDFKPYDLAKDIAKNFNYIKDDFLITIAYFHCYIGPSKTQRSLLKESATILRNIETILEKIRLFMGNEKNNSRRCIFNEVKHLINSIYGQIREFEIWGGVLQSETAVRE